MRPPWIHSIATGFEPETWGLCRMDWDAAQAWCNFVLMRRRVLPNGLSEGKASMRPEAPPGRMADDAEEARPPWTLSNRSCHRSEYAGGGRRLRIKQFLYDWAPPAFDHPLLWRSRNRPFPVGQSPRVAGARFPGPSGGIGLPGSDDGRGLDTRRNVFRR